MGQWYMQHSTLGMWSGGKRKNPSLFYQSTSDTCFEDETAYDKKGFFSSKFSRDSVKGHNVWLNKDKLMFRWSGTGLLKWLKADCRVSAPLFRLGRTAACPYMHAHA